jgi:hypothetical protein
MVVTAKKQRGGLRGGGGGADNHSSMSIPISFGIVAENGETIDLSDPNQRKNLDAEQKAHVKQQFMAMQEQMIKMMADI